MAVYIALLAVFLLLSAFFSSSETAFISLQRYRLAQLAESPSSNAARVLKILEKPERFLSTVLLGNNLANTAAAAIATVLCVSYWGEDQGAFIATILTTVVLLIFCEVTPKTLASQHSERIALTVVRILQFFSLIFWPFVYLLGWIASGVIRIAGGHPLPRTLVSAEDIQAMISTGHKEGTIEEPEAEMLSNVFDFGDRPVSEVLVPRPEIVGVEKGSSVAKFFSIYAQSPLSRFPVYEENLDNIIGILSVKDVMMGLAQGTINADSLVDDLVRPAYFVPESKNIGELFAEMRSKNYRMAVVIDEYGGTAGIVTLSRLMEEIVGPVGDELAMAEREYEAISENTYQIDGSMRVEEANEELNLNLPLGDYETIAGFIMNRLGRIPRQGQQLREGNLKFVVSKMRGFKIEEVLVTKEEKTDAAPAG